jgi:hypothetical protein
MRLGVLLLASMVLGCGATPRRATVPSVMVELPSDAAAAAHACRFEYEVREVERCTLANPPYVSSAGARFDHRHVEVTSGSVHYVVRLVETGDGLLNREGGPARRWEVTDGTHTVMVGENVAEHSMEYLVDGHGALMMAMRNDLFSPPPRLYVIEDGAVVVQREVRYWLGFERLQRSTRGWFATHRHHHGHTTVVALNRDGGSEEITRAGDEEHPAYDIRVYEGHGAVAVTYSRAGHAQLEIHEADGAVRAIDLDEDPGAGRVLVVDMLPVDDGWWVVVEANWDDIHYSGGPPEWRFVHLDREGTRIGEGRVRYDERRAYGGNLRMEGGELRTELTRDVDREHHESITVAIVEHPPCDPLTFATCDARVWPVEATDVPEAREWHRAWVDEANGVSIARHDADDSVLWTLTLPGESTASYPQRVGEVVHVVTRGRGGARLRTLNVHTGESLGNVLLDRSFPESACLVPRGDGLLIGLASTDGLSLHDEQATALLTLDGDWSECHFAELPERIVLAAARVDVHTSAGAWGHVEAFVLSPDARRELAHHVPGLGGGGFRSIADGDGVILTFWDRSQWNVNAWRFGPSGEPREAPRHLATIYGFPGTDLETTALGPSLLWSRRDAHGVVPLCHAEGVDEVPRDRGYTGMSVSIPH